jgi:hypothetical protein
MPIRRDTRAEVTSNRRMPSVPNYSGLTLAMSQGRSELDVKRVNRQTPPACLGGYKAFALHTFQAKNV